MPPTLRKRRHVSKSPSSKNWFDLPFEMREMVINQMDARTRGKFAQCSKLCEKEAKGSKKYLIGIKIDKSANRQLYIRHDESSYNYCLEFVDVSELTIPQSVVIYKTGPSDDDTEQVIKWTKIVNRNAEDVQKRYLKDIIGKYNKSIKYFDIMDETFSMAGIDIRGLRRLKSVLQYFSSETEDLIETGSIDLEQIMRLKTVLLPNTRIKFEDVLKFDGYVYFVRSDDFDEENIKKYLKMWKNGEIHENVIHLMILDEKLESIEGRNITEGLGVLKYEGNRAKCEFEFKLNYERKDQIGLTVVQLTNRFLRITFVRNGMAL